MQGAEADSGPWDVFLPVPHCTAAGWSSLIVSGASNGLVIQLVFLRVSVDEGWVLPSAPLREAEE